MHNPTQQQSIKVRKTLFSVSSLIWLAFVIMALTGAVYLSIGTWERYQDNPIVVSMERDRFSWNTSFPAATICPSFKINEEKLRLDIEFVFPSQNLLAIQLISSEIFSLDVTFA